ncbi:MAG: hypothetical protein HC769_21795 [Cyanobacteria bacterium CRU_2_1]|nr:hypothetical protein [Cyanobacteria bacterium CRU_2_1]
MSHPRVRVTAKQLGDRHFQINLSSRIALITQTLLKPGKNRRMARVKAGYFGFATHNEAMQFANQVRSRFPKARMEVRPGSRLQTAFEVKVAHECVEELAWKILHQQPTTSEAIAQHIAAEQARVQRLASLPSVGQFVDRSTAPLQGRSRPQMARCGDRMVSIE